MRNLSQHATHPWTTCRMLATSTIALRPFLLHGWRLRELAYPESECQKPFSQVIVASSQGKRTYAQVGYLFMYYRFPYLKFRGYDATRMVGRQPSFSFQSAEHRLQMPIHASVACHNHEAIRRSTHIKAIAPLIPYIYSENMPLVCQ